MENGTQMTLDQWMPEIFREPTVGVQDSLAKTSLLQEVNSDLTETEVAYFSRLLELPKNSKKKIDLSGYSLKMLKTCYQSIKDGILPEFSLQWMKSATTSNGGVLNSKDFYVPQNRERVFIIGHLRSRGGREVFPVEGADGEDSLQHGEETRPNTNAPKVIGGIGEKSFGKQFRNQNRIYDIHTVSPCLDTCKGGNRQTKVAIPVLTPDRAKKRQEGRRFKENGEPSFTLTSRDRHGVAVGVEPKQDGRVSLPIREATKQGYSMAYEGDAINLTAPTSKTRRGRVAAQTANTLDTGCSQGIIVKVSDKLTVYAIWYEKYQCYIAIRKLTPKECFRLQGWSDDYFERAEFVNSNSQLYKQAGNGVTVTVIEAMAKNMR